MSITRRSFVSAAGAAQVAAAQTNRKPVVVSPYMQSAVRAQGSPIRVVTMYKFDPKHVHDLSLVESPAEGNSFKLGIKSNNRQVSIIVIDWRATN